jgi:cytochrome b6-f complex iron-sulfur subunit
MSQKEKIVTRRDFLKTAVGIGGALAALELGAIALAYMQPRLVEGEFGARMRVGAVDDFPAGSVTHIPAGRFYLSRLPDGGFLAIYQRCTHLGCSVPWDPAANMFVCPCHNSQFTPDGEVQNPPAPRPLDLFPVTIESGEVWVDTGKPISRQSADDSQIVYPA